MIHPAKSLFAPLRIAVAAFCVSGFSAIPLVAEPSVAGHLSASVDFAAQDELARQHVPGFAIAVVKNGEVVKSAGYGMANIEQGTQVKPQTVFRISSLSKQFLA